jgi:accessory gene regulator B
MNILDKSAIHIAKSIRRNNPNAASEEVLKYPLIVILNTLSVIIIVLLISLVTSHIPEALAVLFFYPVLKYFSGGFHLKTSLTCIMYSSIVTLIIAHISFEYQKAGFIMNIISILILIIYAPTGKDKTSGLDPKYYPVLKIIAILLVASNFLMQSSLLSLTFFLQTLTIPTPIYKLVNYIEGRVSK